jgi:hypothetical protein
MKNILETEDYLLKKEVILIYNLDTYEIREDYITIGKFLELKLIIPQSFLNCSDFYSLEEVDRIIT